MPRRSKGARLWLRRRRGRGPQWVILDHGREVRTGASENDLGAAENALAHYLANKRRPQFGDGHPSQVLIADILAEYGENHGPTTKRPDLIGGAINRLLEFFGDQMFDRALHGHPARCRPTPPLEAQLWTAAGLICRPACCTGGPPAPSNRASGDPLPRSTPVVASPPPLVPPNGDACHRIRWSADTVART